MLGTGTQADPYQITTVEEFRSMTTSTAYYKLMNDIDASTWNNGQWTLATLSFATLDGNGKTFSNIYNTVAGVFTVDVGTCIIENLTFANMIHKPSTSGGVFYSNNGIGTFNNCVFNIDVNNPSQTNTGLFFKVNSINYCTLNLKAITNSFFTLGGTPYSHIFATLNYCAIWLDWTVTGYTSGNIVVGGYYHNSTTTPYLINCYIRGKITNSGGTNSATEYPYITDNANSCYFALEFVGFNYLRSYSKCKGICFYDNTLIQKNGTVTVINPTASTGYTVPYSLTTSQCKDKAYLQSIGFGVV